MFQLMCQEILYTSCVFEAFPSFRTSLIHLSLVIFPDASDAQHPGPVVFEVSPIFDLNPEPPPEWRQRPYRELLG